MSAQYKSKHGIVSRPAAELYMAFTDMRNFLAMLPEDKKQGVSADFDTISATVQGFTIGVKVTRREPYSYIELQDNGAPFNFVVGIHFDAADDASRTDFWVELDAELNFMMKMMLGGKLQEALDKVVDGLVAVSEGRRPEGMPEDFKF
ncbi:MAG: hypothetical protein IJ222_07830 [Bacteroidales bacterium]|nr:hypothetical protein [Bacteroidales bacterium]MBQ9310751.1 hypothetical protein [Bacteroidales bacterium]